MVRDVVLVFLGTLVGYLAHFLQEKRLDRREARRVLTRARTLAEEVFTDPIVKDALVRAGAIRTTAGLFEEDDSWGAALPISPPAVKPEWEPVARELANWEARRRGTDRISRAFRSLTTRAEELNSLHEQMSIRAQQGIDVAPRAVNVYMEHGRALHRDTEQMLREIDRDLRRIDRPFLLIPLFMLDEALDGYVSIERTRR